MGEEVASPAAPYPVYSNKHVLPPPPRIVVWMESKFTSRHPWGGGQWKRVISGGHWGARQACTALYLYIYVQTESLPSSPP